jgi:hypothetical protein
VTLWKVEFRLQCPYIYDVSEEVQVVALHMFEKISEFLGATASEPKVNI